jgi:polysaccharide export outer membrane protein
MKLSLKTVSTLFCAAVLCAAQTVVPPVPGNAGQPPVPDGVSPEALQPPPPVRKSGAAETEAPKPANTTSDAKPYVIGPLDTLYVRVWNNQNLTGIVNVGPDGMISLSLVGQLNADGLTVEQLTTALKNKLGEYITSPEVSIDVTRVNSKKYFVYGGVNRPGPFPLSGRTTVSEALSMAGGFRDFSNQKKIYVLRGAVKHPFNYKDVIAGKHLEQDIVLENGDKIVVPE